LTVPFANKSCGLTIRPLTRFLFNVGFLAIPLATYAQGVDTIVEVPTAKHGSALIEIPTAQTTADSEPNLTVATEFKSTKNVVEEEKPAFWNWYTDVGYVSEYNFRGTDLTPNSDGAILGNVRVTKWNFTLGLFAIHQLGDAHVDGWSVGESGGAGSGVGAIPSLIPGLPPSFVKDMRFPTTIQREFDELDVFLSYKFSLGWIDVTIGDIGFFIERRAETFEKDVLPPGFIWNVPDTDTRVRVLGPEPTVGDEQFDRVYITLSTTKLSKYIRPQITYYQTVYSEGQEPEAENIILYKPVFVDGFGLTPFPHFEPGPGFFRPANPRPNDERNEALGGYLEGRINGSFPITKWLDFNPYTILSVSFRDRTEPGGTSAETAFGPNVTRNGSGVYGAHPLTGLNHFQAGVELPIHLLHLGGYSSERWAPPDAHVYLVPTGAYSYHISNPTPGTDRNEWWGGAKVEVTF
jgi:hypothetical protein